MRFLVLGPDGRSQRSIIVPFGESPDAQLEFGETAEPWDAETMVMPSAAPFDEEGDDAGQ